VIVARWQLITQGGPNIAMSFRHSSTTAKAKTTARKRTDKRSDGDVSIDPVVDPF
jgi:hypothetical protein